MGRHKIDPFTTGADRSEFAISNTNRSQASRRGRLPWLALGTALLLVNLLGGTCGAPDAGLPTTGDSGDQVLEYQPDSPQSNQGDSNTMPDTSPVTLPQLTIQTSVSEGDAPLTVTFTASTLDGQVLPDDASYSWDFGEEAVGSGLQVTHTYTRAAVYAVTLVMTVVVADAPYSASATTNISVRAPQPPVANQPVGVSAEYDVVQDEACQFVLEAASTNGNTRFTIVSPPANGTLDVAVGVGLNSPVVTYTPAVGFSGQDTFTFAAYDASTVTLQSVAAAKAATVTLKVKRKGILSVSSTEGLSSTGNPGGPFSPAGVTYTLANTGERAINWTAAKTQDWITLSKASDWLAAGATDTVTVSVNSAANSLASGSYSDVITFTNTTNAAGNTTRSASLMVIAPPGALSVAPASGLAATGNQGGPFAPASLVYTLTNTGDQSIDWTAAKTQSWVTLSKASGTLTAKATDTVTVSINSAANSLEAGGHSDTVTFTNATNGSGNTTTGVSLTVVPVPGVLSVAPTGGLTSSGTQGGPFSPASLVYTLSNTGGTSINWTAAKTKTWVTLSKAFGTLAAGATDTVTVSINASANGLAAGAYSDLVTLTNVTNAAGSTTRGVSLTVTAVPGALTITPSNGLTSSGTQGGPFSPASAAYTLTNTGGQSINWTATKSQTWLTLSKAAGTLAAGGTDTVTVSINSGANSLAAGGYSDTVTFTNTTNGSGNTTRPVSLTVNPTAGALSVSPGGGLTSSGNPGGPFSPTSAAYTLTNTGGQSVNWTATRTQNWVTLSAASGSLAAGATDTVSVSINENANALGAGVYSDTVTFTNTTNGSGNTARPVSLAVGGFPISGTITRVIAGGGTSPVSGLGLTFTGSGSSTGQNFTATTASDGTYTALAPIGWTGTAAATDPNNWRLTPTNRAYSNIQATQPGQDFFAGRNYYVAVSGSDTNGGTATPGDHWATVQKAADSVQPGDVVYIKTGTYTAPNPNNATPVLNLKSSGTASAPIVFKAYVQNDGRWDDVVLDGRGPGVNSRVVAGTGRSYIVLEGLTVTRGYQYGFYFEDCPHVTMRHCVAHHNGPGTRYGGFDINGHSDNLLIEYCESYSNGLGINVGAVHQPAGTQPDNVTVRNCLVYENTEVAGNSDGVTVSSVTNSLFYRIVAYANSDDGFDFGRAGLSNLVIEQCVAFGNNLQRFPGGNGNGFKVGQISVYSPNPGNNILRNNISFANLSRGFDDGNSRHNVYYHNIACKNISWGWLVQEGNLATLYNNILYRNDMSSPGGLSDDYACSSCSASVILHSDYNLIDCAADYAKLRAVGQDGNSINADPLFVSPPADLTGDYETDIAALKAKVDLRLYTDPARRIPNPNFGSVAGFELTLVAPGSPCIDAGVDVGLPFNGTRPDLGAYETP